MAKKTQNKAIFIDVDGTLCGITGDIPASAREAIQKSRTKGNQVFLCTGRSKAELYDWILDIGFDGIIGTGGSYLELDGNVIFNKQFNNEELLEIIHYFDSQEIDYIMEANHGLYGSMNSREHLQRILPKDDKFYLDTIVFHYDLNKIEGINKFVFLSSKTPFSEVEQKFQDVFQVIPSSMPVFGSESGELALKDIHKAYAIKEVLSQLHIDQADTFAFGDGFNDMEMLQYVKKGIAMKNSHPNLLEIADDITETADNDGLYLGFQKYELL